jgi:MFS family permease
VAVLGCSVNVGAQLLWLTQIQAHPAYLTHLLPAQLLGGAGVGLTIPSLLAAGSASLPPDRFGTGSGILNMARQVGTVLGVAGLVAILARLQPGDPVATFRHGLVMIVAFFAAAGLIAAGLLTGRPGLPPVPEPPVAEPPEAEPSPAPELSAPLPDQLSARLTGCPLDWPPAAI